jgi:hypothetical protein
MLVEPISKTLSNKDTSPEQESNSSPKENTQVTPSFSNFVGQTDILPYRILIKENIKSFNLIPNEENPTKETELENSLKAKYNFDTPTLELVLKITSDYENIKDKLKEYLDLFGENTLVKYDHNANTVKINYKYYFSCLYANRSLTNILQKEPDNQTPMNYYSNCEFSSKSITSTMSSEKYQQKPNSNKDLSQAFKFLTENYKTSAKFKTNIYKEENEKDYVNKNEEVKFNDITQNTSSNIEEMKNNDKEYIFSPNMKEIKDDDKISFSNARTKYKTGNNNYSFNTNRKRFKNNFSNPMNSFYNLLFPQNLYYQYLSMNNPNTLKIPVPVPVPVPFPLSIPKPKSNKTVSLNNNYSSFSNPKIKSSFLKQIKENIGTNENKEKSEIKSNDMNDSSSQILEVKKDSSIAVDNLRDSPMNNSKNNSQKSSLKINESQDSKEKSSDISKKELNTPNSLEKDCAFNEKNSSNTSGNSSKENKEKVDIISSIKSNDKSSFDFLSNADHKKLSLERLNHFLQNNKPISNFNNPIKNLGPDDSESFPRPFKKIPPMPMFFPNPVPFPFKFPKYNRNPFMMNLANPMGFNKNVINFDKLTLNTRNNIKFETHSSRDYYYKYVCNYLVQIENDDNFFVTKRIIGKNGCFLKKIIQEACIKFGDFSTKIRLRGKGSGYIEHNGKESEEPLMLCVSSLNYPTYYNCCMLIDGLMKKIYNDYYEYSLRILPEELRYSMKKKQVIKHEFVVNRFSSNSSGNRENNNSNFKGNNERNNMKDEEEMKK